MSHGAHLCAVAIMSYVDRLWVHRALPLLARHFLLCTVAFSQTCRGRIVLSLLLQATDEDVASLGIYISSLL